MAKGRLPADAVGIQVPVGRIAADRVHWQTVFDARDRPSIYRLHNGSDEDGNAMIVEVDGAKRSFGPGTVLLAEDVTGKGHTSRGIGSAERFSLFIPLDD